MVRYSVLLQRNQDVPGYWVMVPELPGCFSQGRTIDETLDRVREAIQCHLEAMVEDGEEIPVEEDPFILMSVEVEPPVATTEDNAAPGQIRFVMANRGYSVARKQVVEAAERIKDIPARSEKRLWYVQVDDKELPITWFMQELLGVGADDIVLGKSIDVFRKLGFQVIYKGKKEPLWAKRKSA